MVREEDLSDLLPLLRAYCDFYEVEPADEALIAMSRSLAADPDGEGLQLLARAEDGRAVGFATLLWTWQTLVGGRIGIMNDLFVEPAARGGGIADALVLACRDLCGRHGAVALVWQTALDNHRAQRVYDRLGGRREQWLDYSLPVERGGQG